MFATDFDISGDEIDRTGHFKPWAAATLALDKRLFEIDYHMEKVRAMEAKYGPRVRIAWQHEEDWFTLETTDPALSVDALIEEFELVPKDAYHRRCATANSVRRHEGNHNEQDAYHGRSHVRNMGAGGGRGDHIARRGG